MADKGPSPPEVNVDSSLQDDQKFECPPQFAKGEKRGDRVAIYMGMTPELPIAMLARARITNSEM
jgi:hypothetical protein